MKTPIKRKTIFAGLTVNIETEKGDVRTGTDERGEPWAHTYQYPYGEIAGTVGEDGDPVDVYLGPDETASFVYVAKQMHFDGSYDEDKVFLGFRNYEEAQRAYFDHGPEWGLMSFTGYTLEAFGRTYLEPRRATNLIAADRQSAGRRRYGQ